MEKEVTDEDGETKTLMVEVDLPTPDFKQKLQEQQEKVRRKLAHSTSVFKSLKRNSNDAGIVQLPKVDTTKAGKPRKRKSQSEKDQATIVELRAKIRRMQQERSSSNSSKDHSSLELEQQLSIHSSRSTRRPLPELPAG